MYVCMTHASFFFWFSVLTHWIGRKHTVNKSYILMNAGSYERIMKEDNKKKEPTTIIKKRNATNLEGE